MKLILKILKIKQNYVINTTVKNLDVRLKYKGYGVLI